MKKITLALCAFLLMGVSYTHAQITDKESNTHGISSSVDMDELLAVSSEATLRVPTGTTVLDYRQNAFGVVLEPLLTSIGFTVTVEEGTGDLDVLLPSQPWDVVILQVQSFNLLAPEVTAISDYLTGGGRVIMSYWDLDTDPGLAAIVGVSNTIDFFSPLAVSVWEPTDPIFTTPNAIADIALFGGDVGGADNGDRLEPDTGAVALAGFVATPTTNEAAIIEANGGNSYFHGFSAPDMNLTSYLNLIENECEFLFLGVQDNILEGFDYYPNPTSNTLNLRALDNIERVEFFNVLGQKVLDVNINALSSRVNISELAIGTYIMSVTVGTQTGRYKIVKR